MRVRPNQSPRDQDNPTDAKHEPGYLRPGDPLPKQDGGEQNGDPGKNGHKCRRNPHGATRCGVNVADVAEGIEQAGSRREPNAGD